MRTSFLHLNRIMLLSLILIGFALRLHALGTPSLWIDELMQLDIAQGPFAEIWPQLERHAGMPLDYYISFFWIMLGRQESWVRFPAAIFGTLTIPMIYLLGTRLQNQRVGLLAAGLLTTASFAIRYSQETRPYALLTLLSMIGFYAVWQAYRTNHYRYWAIAIGAIAGATLSHYFTLFLLLPLGLFAVSRQLEYWRDYKIWRHTLSFALLLFILASIFILIGRAPILFSVGQRFTSDLSQPANLTRPAAEKPNKGQGPSLDQPYLIDKILNPLSAQSETANLFYHSFLLVTIATLLKRKHPQRAAILLLLGWLILPIILIYLFLLARGTFFATRYILYTLPAYLLLVAAGVDVVLGQLNRLGTYVARTSNAGRVWAALSVALPAIVVLSFFALIEKAELESYYQAASYEDWRSVGHLLQANAQPNDVVIAPFAEPALNWYYPPAQAEHSQYGASEEIWEALAQHQRRWFVLSSYSYKRDTGLRKWLDEQEAVLITIDSRVAVYFHEEGLSGPEMLAQMQAARLPGQPKTYVAAGLRNE